MAITMYIATVNYLMAMFRLSMPYMRMDSPTLFSSNNYVEKYKIRKIGCGFFGNVCENSPHKLCIISNIHSIFRLIVTYFYPRICKYFE